MDITQQLMSMKVNEIKPIVQPGIAANLFEVMRVPGGWIYMRNTQIQEAPRDPHALTTQKQLLTFAGFGVFVPEPAGEVRVPSEVAIPSINTEH